jgi:uncharacterized damage-inducible protein DinB
MMNTAVIAEHWRRMGRDLLRALGMLTEEQLALVPRDGLWSLRKVARHIAEAEEGWFRFAVTRELEEWPKLRDEDYASIASIEALLTEFHERTDAFLAMPARDDSATLNAGFAGSGPVVETPWGEKLALD